VAPLRLNADHVGGKVNRTVALSIETGRVILEVSGCAQEVELC
jgi:hypothetical protein